MRTIEPFSTGVPASGSWRRDVGAARAGVEGVLGDGEDAGVERAVVGLVRRDSGQLRDPDRRGARRRGVVVVVVSSDIGDLRGSSGICSGGRDGWARTSAS